eukprot:06424.XXX_203262_203366_1 [CDS] Oithona nana genome sequencing.
MANCASFSQSHFCTVLGLSSLQIKNLRSKIRKPF